MIFHFLEQSADLYPDKQAVIHNGKSVTYHDVEFRANRIANWLIESGVHSGERVALLYRNSIEYIVYYYGILKAGAVVVPLNTGLDQATLYTMMADCSVSGLITEKYFEHVVNGCVESGELGLKFIVFDERSGTKTLFKGICSIHSEIEANCSARRPAVNINEDNMSSIIYTSGSTGKPKGVVLTHRNIVENTKSIVSYLKLTQSDKIMVILPFYYVYGKTLLNTHFAVSGTVIIDNGFTFPNAVLKNIIKYGATGFAGVASSYSILFDRTKINQMDFPDLRYLTQAGGHMPADVKKQLLRVLPDKEIFVMYGATEASARLAYLKPNELKTHIFSIGKPIPNVRMKIVDDAGAEVANGKEGEIIAMGPNIMKGYWDAPEETHKVLKNNWYHTGDIGRKDDSGFFYVSGRMRDMIKVGIHKVSATEVEDTLHNHPDILEAAVVGIQDPVLGEAVRAFVVPSNGMTLNQDDVIGFCQDMLVAYKRPKEIVIINELPKNEAGKILKRELSGIHENLVVG